MMMDSIGTTVTGLAAVAFPITGSNFYQHWLEEKKALADHKWFLSEQVGRDVGESFAWWDWNMRGYRANWLTAKGK